MSDIVLVPEVSNEQDTHMVPILKEPIIFLKFSELNLHFSLVCAFLRGINSFCLTLLYPFTVHHLPSKHYFLLRPSGNPISSMKSFQISSAGSPISLLILPESHSMWFDSIFHYLVSDLIMYVFFNFGSQYSVSNW